MGCQYQYRVAIIQRRKVAWIVQSRKCLDVAFLFTYDVVLSESNALTHDTELFTRYDVGGISRQW